MAIPAQVRKQSEDIQSLYEQMNKDRKDPKDEKDPKDGNPPGDQDDDVDNQAANGEGTDPKTDLTAPKGDAWEQKYRTLQGMYNKDVPALNGRVRELESTVANLQGLLASTPKTQQQLSPAEKKERKKYITDSDVQEYGDSIEVMRKAAREEMEDKYREEIDGLKALVLNLQEGYNTVAPTLKSLSQKQTISAEQTFWAQLDSFVPNWSEINDNPDFQSWLLEVDPLMGVQRQQVLEHAQGQFDARRVANFFLAWNGRGGSTDQPKGQSKPNPKSQLEEHISPGKARAAAPKSDKTTIWTRDEIAQFFSDVTHGKYRGRDQDKARIEADIFAAQQEGRVR